MVFPRLRSDSWLGDTGRSGRWKAYGIVLLALSVLGCGRAPSQRGVYHALADGIFVPDAATFDPRSMAPADDSALGRWLGEWPRPMRIVPVSGFSRSEEWGRWLIGPESRFEVQLGGVASDRELVVHAHSPPGLDEQTVEVAVNGAILGSFDVEAEPGVTRFLVPGSTFVDGVNRIALRPNIVLEEGVLSEEGEVVDERPLSLGLLHLSLLEVGQRPPVEPFLALDAEAKSVSIATSGTLLVAVDRAPGEDEIQVDLGLLGGDAAEVSGTVLRSDGTRSPTIVGDPGRVGSLAVDFASEPETRLVVAFHVEVDGGRTVTLASPRLVRRGEPEEGGSEGSETSGAGEVASTRPHIVVVVLDAARADHFGAYGYPRATTPVFDALAAHPRSLLFRQVVSECASTVCSMPSLLTGRSLLEHGLWRTPLELSEEIETLAEGLRKVGYHTVASSGNPNNSHLTGTDRGFETFEEIRGTDPRPITSLGVETLRGLASADSPDPLFLHLHYVPPHAPYTPPAEFDVFSDVAYSGPAGGDRRTLRQIEDGHLELAQADRQHLIDLYDGNLLYADAELGQVVDVLEEEGLLSQTLLIVTADHGEGFFEHGELGHNSTVYEEMIRVPLLMHLPAAWVDAGLKDAAALEELSTLADLAATVRRLTGLSLPEGSARDLFGSRPQDRMIPLLSEQRGARTARFKITAGPELYDLSADPGETRNLAAERPLLQAGLTLLLRSALAEARVATSGTGAALTEEEKKHLETLGYL